MLTMILGVVLVALLGLLAAPTTTYNAAGNALSSQSLGASGTVTATVDFSSSTLSGWVSVSNTGGGTVAGTNGCKVEIFAACDSTPNYDTTSLPAYTIATVVSTAKRQSVLLPNGKYQFKLTNLDASNAITVSITSNPTA